MKVNGYKITADNSNATLLELYTSAVEQGTTLKNVNIITHSLKFRFSNRERANIL